MMKNILLFLFTLLSVTNAQNSAYRIFSLTVVGEVTDKKTQKTTSCVRHPTKILDMNLGLSLNLMFTTCYLLDREEQPEQNGYEYFFINTKNANTILKETKMYIGFDFKKLFNVYDITEPDKIGTEDIDYLKNYFQESSRKDIIAKLEIITLLHETLTGLHVERDIPEKLDTTVCTTVHNFSYYFSVIENFFMTIFQTIRKYFTVELKLHENLIVEEDSDNDYAEWHL